MYFLLVEIDWWKPVSGRTGILKTPSNKKAVLWNTFHEIMFSIEEDGIADIMPFYAFDNTKGVMFLCVLYNVLWSNVSK